MADSKGQGGGNRDLYQELLSNYSGSGNQLWEHALRHPTETAEMLLKLWKSNFSTLSGTTSPETDERRFNEEGWNAPYFQALQSNWLRLEKIANEWLDDTAEDAGIEHQRRRYQLGFWLGTLSPKNYALTNPEGWRATQNEGGQNLLRGLQLLAEDMAKNSGLPNKVDKDLFELGKDIATSEGAVIHRDDHCEIIQYSPLTEKVRKKPILIVYSIINKFYLLDLNERRSVIRFLLDQGYQVFIQSWRNPGPEHAGWKLEDYAESTANAFDVVREITGSETLHVYAICAGAFIAYAAALLKQSQGEDPIDGLVAQVAAVDNNYQDTLFGLIGTAESLDAARENAKNKGGLKGDDLSWAVSLMQPDRLIFPYHFESYALGERRIPNEIAYWLSDQVNISTAFFEDLLAFVTENSFIDPERALVKGVPIDLAKLDVDLLLVGAQHDNLVPWPAAYKTVEHVTCDVEFILTNGGHITPATAPRDDKRTGFWSNPGASKELTNEEWFETAEWDQSSWLYYLQAWLDERSGDVVPAPKQLGSAKYSMLCSAPGTYVVD